VHGHGGLLPKTERSFFDTFRQRLAVPTCAKRIVGRVGLSIARKGEQTSRLIDLGWAMTVSARAGYPPAKKKEEPVPHLMAFNEMQRPLFNDLRHSRNEGRLNYSGIP